MKFIFFLIFILLFGACTKEVTRSSASRLSCKDLIIKLTSDVDGAIRLRYKRLISSTTMTFSQFAGFVDRMGKELRNTSHVYEVLDNSPLLWELHLKKAQIDELSSFVVRHNIDDSSTFTARLADQIFKYDAQIPRVAVRDQCGISNCWIQAGTAFHEILYRDALQNTALSDEYFTLINLMDVVKEFATDIAKRDNSFAGANFIRSKEEGNLEVFRNLMETHGIVPKSVWQPSKKYYDAYQRENMYRDIYSKMSELFKGRRNIPASEIDAAITKEIRPIIESYVGELPKGFTYKNQFYLPKDFAHEFFHFDEEGRSVIIMRKVINYNATNVKKGVREAIVTEIDAGRPVVLIFKAKKAVFESEIGLLSQARSATLEGRHQVVVVGYKLDARGNIARIKLANSWGEEHGDNGFIHMGSKYLWQTFDSLGIAP